MPEGSLGFWQDRLAAGAGDLETSESFGQKRLHFRAPEGDSLALVEVADDKRAPWVHGGVGEDAAIRGFHSASLRLRDSGATEELLAFMGYEKLDKQGGISRLVRPGGNGADLIDIEVLPEVGRGDLGAGSVHHVAFAVENRAAQLEVRKALLDTGYNVTPVIDRDYFWAIYFRTPGGVLFEIATNEPGFDRDEDGAHLGEALKLPAQHEHLRSRLETDAETPGGRGGRRPMTQALDTYHFIDRPGATSDAPVLFLLHGTGGDEHQFLDLAAELKPAARRIGIRGDVSEGGALRYFKRLGEGRYDMADLARATAKLSNFVGEVAGDSAERVALGYSNGANIIASVLFEAPQTFDAAVLMHPLIPFTPAPQAGLKGKRILITAGRRDPIAPASSAEDLAGYFKGQGAEVTLFWHEGGHEIRREELLAIRDFLA